jgi:hypothetical protein
LEESKLDLGYYQTTGDASALPRDVAQSPELEFRLVAADGDTLTPADELADPGDRTGQQKLRVLKEVLLDSSAVASASLATPQLQSDVKELAIVLDNAAAGRFSSLTAANIGRRLAIVWRGRVLSAPVIRAPITGPAISVTGNLSGAEWQVLLDLLNYKPGRATSATFGPVIERFVPDNGVIDFDTGNVSPLPDGMNQQAPGGEWGKWMEQNGMDAHCWKGELTGFSSAHGNYVLQPAALVTNIDAWDSVTPAQLMQALHSVDTPGNGAIRMGTSVIYGLKTREGGMVMLQMTGIERQGVKIRYRLVRNGAAAAANYPGDWIWEANSETLNHVPPIFLLRPSTLPAGWVPFDMFGKDRYLARGKSLKELITTVWSQKNSAAKIIFPDDLPENKFDFIVATQPHWWNTLESEINRRFNLVEQVERDADGMQIRYKLVQKTNPAEAVNSALPLDLTPYYTTPASGFDLIADFPAWKSVPRGTQVFDQVPLEIGGMFCLWGEGCAKRKPPVIFPEAVTGIQMNRKFETLYVYHGSFYSSPAGTPVCDVVFRYADGSSATNQMRYGDDFLDWRVNVNGGTVISPAGSNSKLAWVGGSFLPDKIQPLSFCLTAIENPRPQMPVTSVDFYSCKSRTAAVIMAMTTGKAGLMGWTNMASPGNSTPGTITNEPADLREARVKLAELRVDYAEQNPAIQRQLARIKELERMTKEEPAASLELREAKAHLAELRVDYAEQNPRIQEALARIKALGQNGYSEKYVAMIAVRDWLALVDAGAFGQSWETAADSFHSAISKDDWTAKLEKVRTPLGKLVSRTFKSSHQSKILPGLPDGDYFVATFDTEFARLSPITETVVFLRENDQWKAAGYVIRDLPKWSEAGDADKPVIAAAQKWLAGIDAENYSQSWESASAHFRSAVTREQWISTNGSVRKPLGGLLSRKFQSSQRMTKVPALPDGQYLLMRFETSFAEKISAAEDVLFVQEEDGQWKAAGYIIK